MNTYSTFSFYESLQDMKKCTMHSGYSKVECVAHVATFF